jgi:hypothetical protein
MLDVGCGLPAVVSFEVARLMLFGVGWSFVVRIWSGHVGGSEHGLPMLVSRGMSCRDWFDDLDFTCAFCCVSTLHVHTDIFTDLRGATLSSCSYQSI